MGIYGGKPRLTIRMTDLDIIERVDSLFPCSKIQVVNPKPVKAGYNQPQTQYGWRISRSEEVARIIRLILPYLGRRRTAKAHEVLHHIDEHPLKRPGYHNRSKTHCIRGHEFTPENTYIRNYGRNYRRCRKCATITAALRKEGLTT